MEAGCKAFYYKAPDGVFTLVYNSSNIAQYVFKYNNQIGASAAKEDDIASCCKQEKSNDEILPCTSASSQLAIDICSFSIVGNSVLSDLTSALNSSDPTHLIDPVKKVLQRARTITTEVEINNQLILELKGKYPDLQIVTQKKKIFCNDTYDEFGTTQVDMGIFKKMNKPLLELMHLSHVENAMPVILDHSYESDARHTIYCATAELKIQEKNFPQLITGMLHVGSSAAVASIEEGTIISHIIVYGIMHVIETNQTTLLTLELNLRAGTAVLTKGRDTLKMEDALSRIIARIINCPT